MVVLLMMFSIKPARTIRRWCGHTGATLSASTVNRFTVGAQILHFVMAVTSVRVWRSELRRGREQNYDLSRAEGLPLPCALAANP